MEMSCGRGLAVARQFWVICLDPVVLEGFSSRKDSMIPWNSMEVQRMRAPAGTEGPEQGFALTQSHVQDLQGLHELILLLSPLLLGARAFTCNSSGIPASHISPPPCQQPGELGKHQKLSKHPKLRFPELGKALGSLRFFPGAFPNLLRPDPSCSIPTSGCQRALGLGSPFLPHPP